MITDPVVPDTAYSEGYNNGNYDKPYDFEAIH